MKSISAHSIKDAENWPLFLNYIEMLTEFIKPIYFSIPPKIKITTWTTSVHATADNPPQTE